MVNNLILIYNFNKCSDSNFKTFQKMNEKQEFLTSTRSKDCNGNNNNNNNNAIALLNECFTRRPLLIPKV